MSAGGRLVERAGPPSVHALGLSAVALSLLAAAALVPFDSPPLSLFQCPLRAATGLPCLSCGASHAFAHLVHGRPLAALSANPLGALLALACALHLVWTLARLCGLPYAPAAPRATAHRSLRIAALALVLVNWTYLVASS